MTDREWRQVPGFTCYEVSDGGEVRSIATARGPRGEPRMVVAAPANPPRDMHLRVGLWLNGKPQMHYVHRLVLLAFRGPCPEGQEGCHKNDNPNDNRLTNLRWGTRAENETDALLNDRKARGVRQGIAVLTDAKVRRIRARARGGAAQRTIAEEFRISQATVSQVVSRKTWTHV